MGYSINLKAEFHSFRDFVVMFRQSDVALLSNLQYFREKEKY